MSERMEVAEQRAKKLGSGLAKVGSAIWGGIRKANEGLDKLGFPKISANQMIGAKPQPARPAQQMQARPMQAQQVQNGRRMIYCPICGWVAFPHNHEVIERY